jgi:mannan endo-1,4-beta-mannosidase
MPQPLKVGATGPDVILLQTQLNALPSALPRLLIDGNFGPVTLQRVQEFQTTTSLIVSTTVNAKTWAKLLADQPTSRNTFYVESRHLHEPSGQKIILRGINLPLLDDWQFPPSNQLTELAATGANAVRIQWYLNYPPSNPQRLPLLR